MSLSESRRTHAEGSARHSKERVPRQHRGYREMEESRDRTGIGVAGLSKGSVAR